MGQRHKNNAETLTALTASSLDRAGDGRLPDTPWAELALEAGFSDQSHFNREFRTVAGITPRAYRDGVVTRPGRLRI